MADLHFPSKTINMKYAWDASLCSLAFESSTETFQTLSDSNIGVFNSVLMSDFHSFFTSIKTYYDGISKKSFQHALLKMAIKKNTKQTLDDTFGYSIP